MGDTAEELVVAARHLGCTAPAPIGQGGEAVVYSLDAERVLRLSRHPGRRDLAERRVLLEELGLTGTGPRIPDILEVGIQNDHEYAIERRIPGRAVSEELLNLGRSDRNRLVESHMDASASLAQLHLEPREWFGDLIDPQRVDSPTFESNPTGSPAVESQAVRTESWHDYLLTKVEKSLQGVPGLEDIDCAELAAEMPPIEDPCFVHGDAFVSNMMAEGTTITAVIDIGVTSMVGDRRLDPLTSAVYLCSTQISPMADATDRRVALGWLSDAGLAEFYEPTRRWIAAYWARAVDHHELHQWCTSVLLER